MWFWTMLLVANVVFIATSAAYLYRIIMPTLKKLDEILHKINQASRRAEIVAEDLVASRIRADELQEHITLLATVVDRVESTLDGAVVEQTDIAEATLGRDVIARDGRAAIAEDLEASHLRAESMLDHAPGEAADAAAQRNGRE